MTEVPKLQFLSYILTDAGVAMVKLNRPPVNAINRQVLDEVAALFTHFANTAENVRAVVLFGEGKNFAAGADIKEIAKLPDGDAVSDFSRAGMHAFNRIAKLGMPVIAAIRGFCLGGGNELAMACHMRVADGTAKFGQPEIKLGICPGFAGTQRLPRLVGYPNSLRLLLGGETIGAVEAHRIGLVDQLVTEGKDVVEVAAAFATQVAGYSTLVTGRIMQLVDEGLKVSLEDGCSMESDAFGEISKSHDMKEGFDAFINKRPAKFQDR